MTRKTDRLLEKINYKFNNQTLFETALTHSSFVNEQEYELSSNERLEFLGDAVLGMIIAEYFFQKYKNLREGYLSKYRSKIVSENSLFYIGKDLQLGEYIRLGQGEERSGGREKTSILSDCVEALIGAIYLDSNYEKTRSIVLELFSAMLDKVEKEGNISNYKSALQEYCQKRRSFNIDYVLTDQIGPDNDKSFFIDLRVNGKTFSKGIGKSKKKAEQNAAYLALKKLGEIVE